MDEADSSIRVIFELLKGVNEIAAQVAAEPRAEQDRIWLFVMLLIGFALVAWVNFKYSKKLRVQIDGFFTNRHVSQLLRDEGPGSQVPVGMLMAVGTIAYGLFIFLTMDRYNIVVAGLKETVLFAAICGALIAAFILKTGITRLLSFIIGEDQGVSEHIYNMFLFTQISGLALLPVTLAMAYMPDRLAYWAFFTGVVIISLTYTYRILRGVAIGITYKLSAFYLILYICTLEILPLVVAIEAFGGEF